MGGHRALVRDERLLLLFIQPSYCFVIPKRADADGHVLPRLCGLLRQHLGRARGAGAVRPH